jgi:site-specific DNA recombinase
MGQAAYGKTEVVDRKRPTKSAYDRNYYPKHIHPSSKNKPPQEWITIPVPAIISEELFKKAQNQLQENKKFSSRNNKKREYLLSSLLRCKECGYSIYGRGVSKSSTNRRYYKCTGQDNHPPRGRVCSSHPIRVEVLDEIVWQQVKTLIEQPEMILNQYAARVEKKQKQQQSFSQLISKKKKELHLQEMEKERLLDLYQCGQVSLPEIETRLQSIRTKLKKIQDEIMLFEKEEKQQLHTLQLIEQFDDFSKHLATNLSNLDFEQKKQIVRLLVEQIIVDLNNQEITIRHIFPFQKVAPLCCRSQRADFPSPLQRLFGFLNAARRRDKNNKTRLFGLI